LFRGAAKMEQDIRRISDRSRGIIGNVEWGVFLIYLPSGRLKRTRSASKFPANKATAVLRSRVGRPACVKTHGKKREHGPDWRFLHGEAQIHSGHGTDWRFIACNHGVQVEMHAGLVIETPYCTQQTGGLTRGMTLRAIRTIEVRHSL
jgi:hypothetical protein